MSSASSRAARTVRPADVKRMLDAGERVVVLDVRSREEHEAWSIAGSVNVPLPDVLAGKWRPPEGAPVVTVCAHGVRSARAAAHLAERGVDARSMAGGMVAWNSVYDLAHVEAGGGLVVTQVRRVGSTTRASPSREST